MTDHAHIAAHYKALLDEIKLPDTHRITIEAFALDPGVDLRHCTFDISNEGKVWERVVLSANPGEKPRVVGLWRIVPA